LSQDARVRALEIRCNKALQLWYI